MDGLIGTRIQLCGPLVVQLRGEQLKADLPGKQGKVLFAYLVLNRTRHIERDELLNMLWAQMLPMASESSLNALISKLRKALGSEVLQGRSAMRLELGDDAWVDCEAAREGLKRARRHPAAGPLLKTRRPAYSSSAMARRSSLLSLPT